MKALMGFVCVVLIAICTILALHVMDVESYADRWRQYFESVQFAEECNDKLLEANLYSQNLVEIIEVMAEENALMCEREAKMTQVVSQYKEENRRLKQSLTEAVNNLRKQQKELNQLHEHLDRLRYKLEVLEKALEKESNNAIPRSPVFVTSA